MHFNTAHDKADVTKIFCLKLSLNSYSFNKQLLSTNFLSGIGINTEYTALKRYGPALKQFVI